MLENGISTATVPDESKFRSLITFMKQYGTVKVETETISGYNNQLDDAMNQFTVRLAVIGSLHVHLTIIRRHQWPCIWASNYTL